MQNIAVVYYSGYGHTKLVAEKVAQGAHADLISIDNEGNITEQEWEKLDAADAIIFGAPTYMAVRHGNSRNLLMPVPKRGLHVNGRIKSSGVSPTAPA
ncbi:flavodoxin-like protein [Escherichia coli]|nr:flavodoxin-like protein [Escherichia coli]